MSALQTMVFLTFVFLLASGSIILLSSCDLFFFFQSSAVRLDAWFWLRTALILLDIVALSSLSIWHMIVGNHQRRCLLFWHCPCFCIRWGHWLPSWVASFLFMAGVALFFLCKVSASGVRQVLVTMVPDSFRNLSAAFRIFFLTPGGG